jgi:hypothetical protein
VSTVSHPNRDQADLEEFKDMRKAWRKKKRDANSQASHGQSGNWSRNSISSGSEFDRRESMVSNMSTSLDRYQPATSLYRTANDSRPNTGSSVASSSDGRSYFPHQMNVPPFGYGQVQSLGPGASLQARRDSAPQHVSMPYQVHPAGFRQNDEGATPTTQNPFPFAQHQPHAQHQPQHVLSMQPGTGGFPFQALTAPVPLVNGPQHGQFAFQR